VLSAVRSFLAEDLSCHFLPPQVEERRQVLLENLDLLTFGPCPTPPPPPLFGTSSLSASASPQIMQPLLHRRLKRHSMPPAVTLSHSLIGLCTCHAYVTGLSGLLAHHR
ncbi:hypothetical protein TSMEX_001567, partial [Taenia solium]